MSNYFNYFPFEIALVRKFTIQFCYLSQLFFKFLSIANVEDTNENFSEEPKYPVILSLLVRLKINHCRKLEISGDCDKNICV